MTRPKSSQPTPAELEVLKILWESEALTVREVMERLSDKQRAYTSVMSLLNVMAEKELLHREPFGRAFKYQVAESREKTLGSLVNDLVKRAFEGSKTALVAQLLDESTASKQELEEIRKLIVKHQKKETKK